jgi:hypothetical protein
MVIPPAPSLLNRRLQDALAFGVIAAVLAGFGFYIFEISDAPNAPQTTVAAKVVGFGLHEFPRSNLEPKTNVVVAFADGRRDTFLVDADAASRCRIGDRIRLQETKARAGFMHVMMPPQPCG